jgi:hypothetical protein
MYLVELRPGKEELYRTGEELAAAIRSGDVDVHSRIYHRATSKWISVTLHPHYKAIAAEREPAAHATPTGDQRQAWTFFNAASETLAGADDQTQDASASTKDGATGGDEHPWRRPIALSVTGLLLMMGMQLAFFGPRPPWAARKASADSAQTKALVTSTGAVSSPALVSLASTSWSNSDNGDWDVGGAGKESDPAPAPRAATPAPSSLPQAPAIRMNTFPKLLPGTKSKDEGSLLGNFLHRWSAAHDEAQARLESGLRVSRLNQLFSPARLTPNGGVAETRISIAGATNFIRIYHQQREMIDRQYQDSFVVMSKQNKLSPSEIRQWYAKVTPKEIPSVASLSSTILSRMDSLLGVLDAQAGAYRINQGVIHFEQPAASRVYGALRQEISKAVDSARAAGATDSTGPMGYLLEAIGTTRLPKES